LKEFDFDDARGLKRDLIAHLGTLDFVTAKENVVFLGRIEAGDAYVSISHISHIRHRARVVLRGRLSENVGDRRWWVMRPR
jgi:hypothetical protein